MSIFRDQPSKYVGHGLRVKWLPLIAILSLVGCGDKQSDDPRIAKYLTGEFSKGKTVSFRDLPEGEFAVTESMVVGKLYSYEFTSMVSIDADARKILDVSCHSNKAVRDDLKRNHARIGIVLNEGVAVPVSFRKVGSSMDLLYEPSVILTSIATNSSPSTCNTKIDEVSSFSFRAASIFHDDYREVQKYSISRPEAEIEADILEINKSTFRINFEMATDDTAIQLSMIAVVRPTTTQRVTSSILMSSQTEQQPLSHQPSQPDQKIILTPEEEQVVSQAGSGAISRDSQGQLQSFQNQQEFASYASGRGFEFDAAEDAYLASARTGSLASLAESPQAISQAALDMFAHMKNRINSNTGDLDVVFVVDYSGSMEDDIAGVIEGLQSITQSLNRVIQAGRSVKVGIVTFGREYSEQVELQPTRDMYVVSNVLENLLEDFPNFQHSTDPGEACYLGLNCAAEKINWSAQNRMAIVITDEASWEVRTGRTDLVEDAIQNIRANAVESGIYTIVTQ